MYVLPQLKKTSPNAFIKTEIKSLSKTKAWRACVGGPPGSPGTVPPAAPTVGRFHVCLFFLEPAPLTSFFIPRGLCRDITSSERTSLVSLPSFLLHFFWLVWNKKLHVFKECRGGWWRTAKTFMGISPSALGVGGGKELWTKRQEVEGAAGWLRGQWSLTCFGCDYKNHSENSRCCGLICPSDFMIWFLHTAYLNFLNNFKSYSQKAKNAPHVSMCTLIGSILGGSMGGRVGGRAADILMRRSPGCRPRKGWKGSQGAHGSSLGRCDFW